MQWPSRAAIYGGHRELEAVCAKITLIANAISKFERIAVLARPDQSEAAAKFLGRGIEVWQIPTEDLWCRGSGPTFVVSGDGRTAVSDLNFNGWGGTARPVAAFTALRSKSQL